MKNVVCIVMLAVLASCTLDQATAEMNHSSETLPPTFELVITFTGLVDVLSDGTGNPETLWLALPDASNVEKLKLSETLKGRADQWLIAEHEARLFGASPPGTPEAKRCGRRTEEPSFALSGYKLTLEGEFLEPGLVVDRSPRGGPVPCDMSTDSTCTDPRSPRLQELSVEWLPRIDDVLPYGREYREGLLAEGAEVLSAVFEIEQGRLFTGGLWKVDDSYLKIDFPGVPPSRWDPRAAAKQVMLVMDVIGDSVTLRGTPFNGSTTVDIEIEGQPGDRVELLVENQPRGSDDTAVKGLRICDGEVNDFAAHYVLRKDSSHLVGPLLTYYATSAPSSNPQCSPSQNQYP